jgi:hypothetical protein
MVPIKIQTETDLKALLKQHTGSDKMTWDLRGLILANYTVRIGTLYYLAYSRGKSTLIFRQNNIETFLLEVIPKRICRSFVEGIDASMLRLVTPLINAGSHLIYSNRGLSLELNQTLTPAVVLDMLRAGWTEYFEFPRGYGKPQLRMRP